MLSIAWNYKGICLEKFETWTMWRLLENFHLPNKYTPLIKCILVQPIGENN